VQLDWEVGQFTTWFVVESSGDWTITILSLDDVRVETVPALIPGTGDDVIALVGGDPDIVSVDATRADSNFVIWAYRDDGRDLLVNEIAPYRGVALAGPGVFIFVVQADGDWSLDVTGR
jgi:hypothetical protein